MPPLVIKSQLLLEVLDSCQLTLPIEFSPSPETEIIDHAKPKRICTELFYQIEYLRGSRALTASAEAAVYALQRDFILLDCAVLNLGNLSE